MQSNEVLEALYQTIIEGTLAAATCEGEASLK